MDSVEDTLKSQGLKSSLYIDIDKLKEKTKLTPDDFPSRKEALAYAESRLDSVLNRIDELENDMVFLADGPNKEEVNALANKWICISQDLQEASK